MKNIILVFLLFSFTFSFSQRLDITSEVSTLNLSKRLDGDSSIQGSQYVNDIFMSAKIALVPNKIFSVRYNAFTDDMEVDDGTNSIFVLDKNMDNLEVELMQGNSIYKPFSYSIDNNATKRGFFLVLNPLKNHIRLLKQQKIILNKAKEAKSSYQQAVPAHFKRTDDIYFLQMDDKPAIKISNNKKDFAALFPAHEDEIIKFIKSSKINLKTEADLMKLTTYLNQLK